MGQVETSCASCSQQTDDVLNVASWEECVSVAVAGDKEAPLCHSISACDRYAGSDGFVDDDEASGMPGIDYCDRCLPPPLEVPAGLGSAFDPGALLGPPLLHQAIPSSSSSSGTLLDGSGSDKSGLRQNQSVQQLLKAFVDAIRGGVGISLVLEGVGIIVVEARLNQQPTLSLQLRFNCIERVLPLHNIQDVTIERACPNATSSAWLVRLCLVDEQAFDFVFDGTQDGSREAHYMGSCLRLLVDDAKSMAPEVGGGQAMFSRSSVRVVRATSTRAAASRSVGGGLTKHADLAARKSSQTTEMAPRPA